MTEVAADPYSGLADADADWLRRRTDELNDVYRRSAADILRIGLLIAEVKRRLDHGRFLKWAAAALPFTPRAAQLMMAAADAFAGKSETVSYFEPSALYVLAQPSTPPEARQEAIERAGRGERISKGVAVELIRRAKTPAPEPDLGPDADIGDVDAAGALVWADEVTAAVESLAGLLREGADLPRYPFPAAAWLKATDAMREGVEQYRQGIGEG